MQNMDDFHKPTLDAIGFQELITEEAAAWSTELTDNYTEVYQSLGKQPSWIEYTTDVNETYGEFAAGMPLAFMCLNRVYEEDVDGTNGITVNGATTLLNDTWYYIAGTFNDAANSQIAYLNGVSDNSTTNSNSPAIVS